MRLLSDEELLSKLPTPNLVGFADDVTWHDLVVLTNPRYPASEKMIAAQWVAYCWFRNPIAPQRWSAIGPAIRQEIQERAAANGTTPEMELRASVVQALFVAEGEQPVDFVSSAPRQAFLRRLNNLVVEDLLGPDWRHRPLADIGGLEDILVEQADHAGEVEVALDLESMIARAHLGEKEAQIVRAIYEGEQPDEIAEKLGKKPGAVRTALSRARSKLRMPR